jgi:proline dehydrogenase
MLDALPRTAFSVLASSTVLKRLASKYGMRRDQSFARRFIAGETIEEVIEVVRTIERAGLTVTLDYLGERASSTATAAEATQAYVAIIGALAQAGVGHNLSVKLTQLGVEVDQATSIDNLRRIVDAAAKAEFFVRIDMEGSAYTDQTLDTFETLWSIGYRNTGVVIQSCLRRSPADIQRVSALQARVRLVKGAYNEPSQVAFRHRHEVDAAFVDLMKVLLQSGTYPAIATHDPAMIAATAEFAASQGLGKDRFEFQMLYGIRRDLQAQLHADGHVLRVYVPFGREWFPYFMRRLGERPANVGFVVGSVLKERREWPTG